MRTGFPSYGVTVTSPYLILTRVAGDVYRYPTVAPRRPAPDCQRPRGEDDSVCHRNDWSVPGSVSHPAKCLSVSWGYRTESPSLVLIHCNLVPLLSSRRSLSGTEHLSCPWSPGLSRVPESGSSRFRKSQSFTRRYTRFTPKSELFYVRWM